MTLKKRMNLVYIGFAFSHHKDTYAGYHHVKNYVGYKYIVDCQSFIEKTSIPPKNILVRCWRFLMKQIFGFQIFPCFLLRILWLNYREKNLVFHFIYGENLYSPILKKMLRSGNKIVCTLHQPYEWFVNQKKWCNWLRDIDRIILVGKTEVPLFEQLSGKKNVVYVPHGICTDFYSYNEKSTNKSFPMLLTVGNWLRDYELANKVYKELLQQIPTLKIYVVASNKCTEHIDKDERITCLTGISDEELRDLYWNCNVLFLPLVRYTANNALLESASCGCNIVIASNQADNSYIPQNFICHVGLDIQESIIAIKAMLQREKNSQLSTYVENHFSWRIIGNVIEKNLKTI